MESSAGELDGMTSTEAPRVSAIIPAYEASGFIDRALESVLHQTFSGWEAIVINDGSPDTEELETALQPFLHSITYIKQENAGPAAARNRGIRVAKGELLAFLDADDDWDPRFLEEQVGFLDENPNVDLVYCDGLIVGNDPRAGRRFMDLTDQSSEPTFLALVLSKATVITSGTVVRKHRVDAVGGFDESLRRVEDFDLWLRLARSGAKLAARRSVLVHRQFHGENITSDSTAMARAQIAVLEKVVSKEPLGGPGREAVDQQLRRLKANLAIEQSKDFLRRKEFQQARSEVVSALENWPRLKWKLVLLGLRVAPQLVYTSDRLRLLRKPSGRSAAKPEE